jgi:hypothetical protein
LQLRRRGYGVAGVAHEYGFAQHLFLNGCRCMGEEDLAGGSAVQTDPLADERVESG